MMIEIILASLGLLLSMFFSYSELALISANKLQINVWEKQKVRFSKISHLIVENKEDFMTTILVGNNLSNILATTYGTIFLIKTHIFVENSVSIVLLVAVTILVFCEIIPKTIVKQFSNTSLLKVSPILIFSKYIFYPISIVLKQLIMNSHKSDIAIQSEKAEELREDIQHVYEHADDSASMEKEQQEMISTVFSFGDKTASDVMTPRTNLSCISSKDKLESALHKFIDSGHSKLPVFDSDTDNIIGIIYLYDLYNNPNQLSDVIKQVIKIPFSKGIIDVMSIFQNKKHNVAIVLDEHGGTAGLITAEDIFEEVFGNFEDEFDHNSLDCRILEDGSILADSKVECKIFNDKFGNIIPQGEYETLSGYVISIINRIPHLGERLSLPIGQVVIKSASTRKIEQIQFFLSDQ